MGGRSKSGKPGEMPKGGGGGEEGVANHGMEWYLSKGVG